MRHQRNSRPGTRREIIPARCGYTLHDKSATARRHGDKYQTSRTPVREPTLRERKTRPEPREEARGASVLSRGRRIRQTLAQL